MRFSALIASVAICLTSEAALRFTEPVWRADLGFNMPGLAGAVAAPTDLPCASSYLVSGLKGRRLEDRFDTFGLWTSATVRGRWRDPEGRMLLVARLATRPPDDAPGTMRTRRSYRELQANAAVDPKNRQHRDEAVAAILPMELGEAAAPRRSQRKNMAGMAVYPAQEENVLVYAFRPRSPERLENPGWFLAVLAAVPGEDMAAVRARFDEDFLDRISVPSLGARRSLEKPVPVPPAGASEAELLRADLRSSIANYEDWCCTEAEDVVVMDDLDPMVRAPLLAALTNNLPRLRRAYAHIAPSSLSDATNSLAVVRVFRDKEEYLTYVGAKQSWTSALWSPERRELVLYHPEGGTEKLLRTVWHEAFHQYLAYAGAMIDSSPWFNEGFAQLFEFSGFDRRGEVFFGRDAQAAAYVHEYAASIAERLPALFEMDYADFYDGSQEQILERYRIAWSIAYFLEVGAPQLRFRPYERLCADYMSALVSTRSMSEATAAAFGDEKSRDEFVAAWLAFWREN